MHVLLGGRARCCRRAVVRSSQQCAIAYDGQGGAYRAAPVCERTADPWIRIYASGCSPSLESGPPLTQGPKPRPEHLTDSGRVDRQDGARRSWAIKPSRRHRCCFPAEEAMDSSPKNATRALRYAELSFCAPWAAHRPRNLLLYGATGVPRALLQKAASFRGSGRCSDWYRQSG